LITDVLWSVLRPTDRSYYFHRETPPKLNRFNQFWFK